MHLAYPGFANNRPRPVKQIHYARLVGDAGIY